MSTTQTKMRNHRGTCWLSLRRRGHSQTIQKTQRLSDILENGSNYPTLFLCIGNAAKTEALKWLAPSFTHQEVGEIHLRPAANTRGSRKILFADGTSLAARLPYEFESTGDPLPWLEDVDAVVPTTYARLIGPFADVVCAFLSDFEGLSDLCRFISLWIESAGSSPSLVLPRLVVAIDEAAQGPDRSQHWEESFIRVLKTYTSKPMSSAFSGLKAHFLSPSSFSFKTRYGRLRDTLLAESELVRSVRIGRKVYFHKADFLPLWDNAYKLFLENAEFDYILASRTVHPVSIGVGRQIAAFLKDFIDDARLQEFALPVIASSIILESFPPQMHNFNPTDVYRTLYQSIWKNVVKSLGLPNEYASILEHIISNRCPSGQVRHAKDRHRQLVQSFRNEWKIYHNDDTCLMCIHRGRPEFGLPCGHAFCEIDIRRYSQKAGRNTYLVESCFLCCEDTKGAVFKLKPNTKGIKVLTIDGGGVRGIVPLQILHMLEQALEPYLPNFPVQNHFDMIFGTSSGGVVSLATGFQGIRVSECIARFQSLSIRAFTSLFPQSSALWKAVGMAVSLFTDSLYTSHTIDEALQQQFGTHQTLSDYSPASARGAKVGVTVTGIPNGEYVITNYNGKGSKEWRRGYRHILPKILAQRIRVWEAARATTAAPWYFKPHVISGVGKFQDGGLWRNNPLDIAVSEARALWPEISKPDMSLSLGTAHERESNGPPSPGSSLTPMSLVRTEIQNVNPGRGFGGFVKRLLESFLYSIVMDGEKFHLLSDQLSQGTDRLKNCFRLNVELPGPPPALDDVDSMDDLRAETYKQYAQNKSIDKVGDILISTLFYLELTSRPIRHRNAVSCTAHILCNIDPGPTLAHLIKTLEHQGSTFDIAGNRFPVSTNGRNLFSHEFTVPISISVSGMDAIFPVSLRFGDQKRNKEEDISASPFTLRGLLQAQGWSNHFGCEDHGPNGPERLGSMKRHSSLNGLDMLRKIKRRIQYKVVHSTI